MDSLDCFSGFAVGLNAPHRTPARRFGLRAFVAKNDSLDRFSGYAEREYAETYPGPSP